MKAIRSISKLGFIWDTSDPFLFLAYHRDLFPASAGPGRKTVPSHLLRGRNIGSDFEVRNGFRMYHGDEGVPGFPQHPHRGFETITIITEGVCDHSDSLGALGRFGGGGSDTQWVTTGKGMSHAEMFPLIHHDRPNHMELFQIWINLPRRTKFAKPHFTMLWSERNPVVRFPGATVTVIADQSHTLTDKAQPPPPESWASQEGADVAIWLIDLDAGAQWTLPVAASEQTCRQLYFFQGESVEVENTRLELLHGVELAPLAPVALRNIGAVKARFLLLQARPIAEPVAQRGPFVLNTEEELMQTFMEYQKTHFGGWPWPSHAPTHDIDAPRFARYPDGRVEYPDKDFAATERSEL